ncbi:MAG: UTRA domain-containing protein [Pseudomonadota bacterium]
MPGTVSYVDVKSEIVGRIRRGDWPLDTIIPGEIDLAAELGCARATVNRALRELAEEGVVERRRKAGTRVVAGQSRSARIEIPVVRIQVESTGARYGYRLMHRETCKAPPAIAERLGLETGAPVLHAVCLHLSDDTPHQYEWRWINLAAVPAASDEPFQEIGPNEWLVREKPLTDAEHVLSAANASAGEAEALGIAAGDAVFVVERRTWLERQTLTYVRLIHEGRTFRIASLSSSPDAVKSPSSSGT